MSSLPLHTEISGYEVEDDCLLIGGTPVTRLADRVGSTPFFAYDRALIAERVQHLRRHLPAPVHLHYAIKANPMPAVVQHLASLVDGLDVASGAELQVALDAGMAPDRISFAGPGKRLAELEQAIGAGVTLNVESERELERIAQIAREGRYTPRVAVRVNPDFELKASGMKMSGGPKQFGIDAERVPQMLGGLDALGVKFVGFHIFSGSQNLRADSIEEAQAQSVNLAIELAKYAPAPVQVVNIGGGFGIPYFPGDKPLAIDSIGHKLADLAQRAHAAMPGVQLVVELGRYLVGEAGVYVCRVIDRKISRGQVFLVTDGGLHHQLAASGNFGQVIRKNYPVLVANKVQGRQREIASVVGPLCTPLDLLADRMDLAVADEGDLIVVMQSGAYGLSASPINFLSHPRAQEILV